MKEYIRGKYSKDLAAAAGAKHFWPGKFIVDWASDAIAVERVEGKGRGVGPFQLDLLNPDSVACDAMKTVNSANVHLIELTL